MILNDLILEALAINDCEKIMDQQESVWHSAVVQAIRELVSRTPSRVFTRQQLIDAKMNEIIENAQSEGATPGQTLSRVLQELRDAGKLEFLEDKGTYRWLG